MADDRMLSDEILLGIIKSKSGGGGGGGTSNYNDLSNKPQINGNTLTGNKSASDLGLVAAETGKGLSTNDYTDADKAIVGGVTAALAGKQGVLTAGKYIDIDENNEISVDPVVPNETFKYVLQQIENYTIKVTKSVNNVVVSEEIYGPPADWDTPVAVTLDEAIYLYIHMNGTIYYDLLIASDTHDAGYHQQMVWYGRDTYTENFSTVDHSGEKLTIKSEMDTALATKADLTDLAPAFSTATAYTVGQYVSYDGNIYKCTSAHSAGAWAAGDFTLVAVGSELESKQNATDNSLQTTDKTVVGAVNELKSGLTNVQSDVKLNTQDLTTPSRTKNILPITLASLKALNTDGTWSGSSYTVNGVTFAVSTDSNGNISKINATGTTSGVAYLILVNPFDTVSLAGCLINGLPSEGSSNSFNYRIASSASWSALQDINSNNTEITNNGATCRIAIRIQDTYEIATGGIDFYPMLRIATETDATYAPYIPSVESRIEAVENGLVKITKESFEQITVNAGSKKFVTNVGLLTDNLVVTAYSDNSDVIAYVATATTPYQVYLYNPTNSAVTSNITVMVAKV